MIFTVFLIGGFHISKCEAGYCDVNTYVLFGNGMFNSKGQITSSVKALEGKMNASGLISGEQWAFGYSFNNNEGIRSVFEVFRQRMGDQTASYWRWLGDLEIAPVWFQSAAQSVASDFDFAEHLIDEDLQQHVQRYEALLMEGNRVLVVAHSQGNLYANSAYSRLTDKGLPMDSFGIVSVANPASHVAGGGPYFTLVNDMVIYAVNLAFPNTLPANVANIADDTDWTNHSFIDSYLNGNQSGPMIINSALSEADALAWPTPQVGKGLISVTLTWGEQPDVDLHIFEPNGSHVYYADPFGQAGHLDQDDTNAYGPEHYYIESCDSLEPGLYGVAVNYYRGNAPEIAHIQIQAGHIVRNYSTPLFMAYGSSGNSRARPVAFIDVINDVDQGYEFKVIGL